MKRFAFASLLSLALAIPGIVVAQSSGSSFDAPRQGATVGDSFELIISTASRCPEGPVSVEDSRGVAGNLPGQAQQIHEGASRFRYNVDLSQPMATDAVGRTTRTVQPGKVTFSVGGNEVDCESSLTVTYAPEDETVATDTTTPVVTPAPTGSPSASPVLEVEDTDTELSPAVAMLIGALVGGTLVAGAEYTAHRYRAKHPKKKK